jgi:hypothetical protein
MRITANIQHSTMSPEEADAAMRKAWAWERSAEAAAYLLRKQDDKRWGEDGKPRNRAERRRAASLGRC